MSETKKYFWLRLKRDFFKRHDIQIIESMENGKDYILFYLKLLCESVDHEGELRFSEQIPYNEQMLATITRTNIDIVRSAIKAFTGLHMMEVLDDGTLYMNEVQKMIGCTSQDEHTRESTRLRVQRYRERQKALPNKEKRYSNVTCNGEIELEIEKDIDNTLSCCDEIIRYLNEKAETHYRDSKETIKLIKARTKEGYTVEDFKKVIDKKAREWKGTERAMYLRPSTLFAPSHFEEYLNAPEKTTSESGTNAKNQFNRFNQRTDYDFEALEKKLIKN